jgi:glucosamine--fructose-6-phosphate aminotransferase (isomerizing)
VASTKAFSCQVAVLNILAAFVSRNAAFRLEVMTSLQKVPGVLESLLNDATWMAHVESAAALLDGKQHALFLGRGLDFPVALEGSLKLKEISYIHAEGIAAGEAKHGPIALIDENMPVVFVVGAQGFKDGTRDARGKDVFEKIVSNMEEIRARKGRIICVTDMDPDSQIEGIAEHVIRVPYINNTVAPIIKVLPLQLIAYHAAVRRGLDPDKPKNLAKSVTVV